MRSCSPNAICIELGYALNYKALQRDVTKTSHVDDKISESKELEMAIAPGRLQVSRQVYLWLMAAMYLFAFSSLYSQIPGTPTVSNNALYPRFYRHFLPHGCQPK